MMIKDVISINLRAVMITVIGFFIGMTSKKTSEIVKCIIISILIINLSIF